MLHFVILLLLFLLIVYIANPKALTRNGNTSIYRYLFVALILALLSALKASTIGNDSPEYIRIFETCSDDEFGTTRYEIGYIYYNKLLNIISSNPQILFIITSAFIFLCVARFIWKYSQMPWFSMMLFFLNGTFAFFMSALRQSMALSILLFAYEALINKKYLLFISICILASFFHLSALLFLVCLPLTFVKLNKISISVLIIVSFFSILLFESLLETALSYVTAYQRYVDGVYFEGDTRAASILQLILAIIFLLVGFHSFGNKKTQDNINSKMVVMFFVAVYLYVLCLKVNLIDRFAIYFSFFTIIYIPNAINGFSTYGKKRLLINGLILFYSAYIMVALVYRPNWNTIYPYKFFWEEKVRVDYIDRG